MDYEEQFYKLTQIGISLCKETHLDVLLHKILEEARHFTNAEGGSLYICENQELSFQVAQNDQLPKRNDTRRSCILTGYRLPINSKSAAGYVALTGKTINIEDAYNIPGDTPFTIDNSFDQQNNYRTRSMLLVPIQEAKSPILGVLGLVNARSQDGEVISFDTRYESLLSCLASHAALAISNARLNEKLKNAYMDTIFRLCRAAEYKDSDTAAHLKRISDYCGIIAEELGLSDTFVENIKYASPMHDVGKIGVSDAILLKPGKLTPEEFNEMKNHTVYGAEILRDGQSEVLQLSAEIALAHHEKYDGSGYPQGLSEKAIPLSGRIVAIADVFDALLSKRCYKEAWEIREVIEHIRSSAGSHFDPEVVAAFDRALPRILSVVRKYSDANLDDRL